METLVLLGIALFIAFGFYRAYRYATAPKTPVEESGGANPQDPPTTRVDGERRPQ